MIFFFTVYNLIPPQEEGSLMLQGEHQTTSSKICFLYCFCFLSYYFHEEKLTVIIQELRVGIVHKNSCLFIRSSYFSHTKPGIFHAYFGTTNTIHTNLCVFYLQQTICTYCDNFVLKIYVFND